MALSLVTIGGITKLLAKLTTMIMVTEPLTRSTRDLIKSFGEKKDLEERVSQLEAKLKTSIELAAKLSEETNEQIRIIQSLFENIKKSLRILNITIYCIGLIALLAIVIALIK